MCFTITFSQETLKKSISPYFNAIIVNDIDLSISWYKKVFNLEVINHIKNEERGFSQANLKNDKLWFEFIQLNSAFSADSLIGDKSNKARIKGLFKIGYRVDNIEAYLKSLQSNGIANNESLIYDPLTASKIFIIKDPDGNRIQFFESDRN